MDGMRVTGAWTALLKDYLDREALAAPQLRAQLARYAPEDIVPFPQWQQLLEATARLQPHEPALGLQIARGIQTHHIGVLGYLVLSSSTLGEAMLTYQRYERLFYGSNLVQIEPGTDSTTIAWPRNDQGRLAIEVSIGALVTFVRQRVDPSKKPRFVSFTYEVDELAARRYEAFFDCPIKFGDSHTRVGFAAHFLLTPMPEHDPGLRGLLDRQAHALLQALPAPHEFDRAIQQMLVRMLPEGDVSLERLSRQLHQSRRTLQRRLSACGITWQVLLDRTRETLAQQYLRDRSLAIAEVAILLGYSEQSAFTHAFARWTGLSPSQYRQGQHAQS